MCDTLVATPAATADGVMLFAKNSDRQRNEGHRVERVEGGEHPSGATIACTYIEIPQVRRTYSALFCRPFWTWGPEMGANDQGLVIGNEAVHPLGASPQKSRLIGMDLAGLALQRAASAPEAIQVITGLLATYGQGGDCGHVSPSYYHNSYILADAGEAWVLETVGREWMAERVETYRAISNGYSIARPDLKSSGLDARVREHAPEFDGQDYAAALGDPQRHHLGEAGARRARATVLLEVESPRIDSATMMKALRDHGASGDPPFDPAFAQSRSICMHAAGHERGGQTTGSLVSQVSHGTALHWVTGTAAPCLSIFKPAFADVALPAETRIASDRYDPKSLWWRHEQLHRRLIESDFAAAMAVIAPERDRLETYFRERMVSLIDADRVTRTEAVAQCWAEAAELEAQWMAISVGEGRPKPEDYIAAWRKHNRLVTAGERNRL